MFPPVIFVLHYFLFCHANTLLCTTIRVSVSALGQLLPNSPPPSSSGQNQSPQLQARLSQPPLASSPSPTTPSAVATTAAAASAASGAPPEGAREQLRYLLQRDKDQPQQQPQHSLSLSLSLSSRPLAKLRLRLRRPEFGSQVRCDDAGVSHIFLFLKAASSTALYYTCRGRRNIIPASFSF